MEAQDSQEIHPAPSSSPTTVPYFDGSLEEQTYFALNSLLVVERLLAGGKAVDLEPDELLAAEALLYQARTFLKRLNPVGIAMAVEDRRLVVSPKVACLRCQAGEKEAEGGRA